MGLMIGNDTLDLAIATSATRSTSAAHGPLYGCLLNLVQANFPIDRNTTWAALNAASATFNGYAAESITWDAPSQADDGAIEVLGFSPTFRPADDSVPNTIWGWYLVEGSSTTTLLFCGPVDDAPIPMGSALDTLTLTFRYRPETAGLTVSVS